MKLSNHSASDKKEPNFDVNEIKNLPMKNLENKLSEIVIKNPNSQIKETYNLTDQINNKFIDINTKNHEFQNDMMASIEKQEDDNKTENKYNNNNDDDDDDNNLRMSSLEFRVRSVSSRYKGHLVVHHRHEDDCCGIYNKSKVEDSEEKLDHDRIQIKEELQRISSNFVSNNPEIYFGEIDTSPRYMVQNQQSTNNKSTSSSAKSVKKRKVSTKSTNVPSNDVSFVVSPNEATKSKKNRQNDYRININDTNVENTTVTNDSIKNDNDDEFGTENYQKGFDDIDETHLSVNNAKCERSKSLSSNMASYRVMDNDYDDKLPDNNNNTQLNNEIDDNKHNNIINNTYNNNNNDDNDDNDPTDSSYTKMIMTKTLVATNSMTKRRRSSDYNPIQDLEKDNLDENCTNHSCVTRESIRSQMTNENLAKSTLKSEFETIGDINKYETASSKVSKSFIKTDRLDKCKKFIKIDTENGIKNQMSEKTSNDNQFEQQLSEKSHDSTLNSKNDTKTNNKARKIKRLQERMKIKQKKRQIKDIYIEKLRIYTQRVIDVLQAESQAMIIKKYAIGPNLANQISLNYLQRISSNDKMILNDFQINLIQILRILGRKAEQYMLYDVLEQILANLRFVDDLNSICGLSCRADLENTNLTIKPSQNQSKIKSSNHLTLTSFLNDDTLVNAQNTLKRAYYSNDRLRSNLSLKRSSMKIDSNDFDLQNEKRIEFCRFVEDLVNRSANTSFTANYSLARTLKYMRGLERYWQEVNWRPAGAPTIQRSLSISEKLIRIINYALDNRLTLLAKKCRRIGCHIITLMSVSVLNSDSYQFLDSRFGIMKSGESFSKTYNKFLTIFHQTKSNSNGLVNSRDFNRKLDDFPNLDSWPSDSRNNHYDTHTQLYRSFNDDYNNEMITNNDDDYNHILTNNIDINTNIVINANEYENFVRIYNNDNNGFGESIEDMMNHEESSYDHLNLNEFDNLENIAKNIENFNEMMSMIYDLDLIDQVKDNLMTSLKDNNLFSIFDYYAMTNITKDLIYPTDTNLYDSDNSNNNTSSSVLRLIPQSSQGEYDNLQLNHNLNHSNNGNLILSSSSPSSLSLSNGRISYLGFLNQIQSQLENIPQSIQYLFGETYQYYYNMVNMIMESAIISNSNITNDYLMMEIKSNHYFNESLMLMSQIIDDLQLIHSPRVGKFSSFDSMTNKKIECLVPIEYDPDIKCVTILDRLIEHRKQMDLSNKYRLTIPTTTKTRILTTNNDVIIDEDIEFIQQTTRNDNHNQQQNDSINNSFNKESDLINFLNLLTKNMLNNWCSSSLNAVMTNNMTNENRNHLDEMPM